MQLCILACRKLYFNLCALDFLLNLWDNCSYEMSFLQYYFDKWSNKQRRLIA